MHKRIWLFVVACAVGAGLHGRDAVAAVKTPAFISDGMVLQHGTKVPVWGTADPGEKVTVRFQDQTASATAGQDGKWLVRLKNLKPGGPFAMIIQGHNKLLLRNVLVGEVWLCSGQSNMEMRLADSADAQEVIEHSKDPMIHLFTVAHASAASPAPDVTGSWSECGPKTVPSFSAVAYFFGRDLRKALGVPVGLIHSSVGGTPAEQWTSASALKANPELKGLQGSGLYNGMIAPLVPYAIRGAIWYQGESNAGRAVQYQTLFPAMIKDWRTAWKAGDFPFLFVQIAPWQKIQKVPADSAWAELREAQRLTSLKVPNTAMAVITDVGDEADIHPKRKAPVGGRLALAARALAYGEKVEYAGPVYAGMEVEGDKAVLSFKHRGGGLGARGGALEGFTVAGGDHKFVNAKAEIRGDKVVVWSPHIKDPTAVRFGWANYPVVNLWSKAGLPASPFRTDDLPLTTRGK
ncbi:MAG TPA: sialate O-acetylesterase [Gemmataceae bacterium]|jgi:sialate O-acetylesterase|nr:sialate O-acetylesterase [Gemmataceae bacterium]